MKPRLALTAATVLATAAPVLGVATAAHARPVAKAPVVYRQKDSGRTVTAFVGKPFKIRLEVCGDCGDSLKLTSANTPVLHMTHVSLTSTAKPPAVGGEQFETWTFEARKAGRAAIRVVERRAEKGGKTSPRFRLTVRVSKLVVDN